MLTLVALLALAVTAQANDLSIVSTGKLCSRGECEGGSTIGAEIRGVTSFDTLTDAEVQVIRGALVEHGVIHFQGVGHLFTPEIQLAFAERFGTVLPDVSGVPAYVEKGVHQSTHSVRHDKRTEKGTKTKATESVNTMVEANKLENKMWNGKAMPARVARLVREPSDPFAFGEGYHADVTFYDQPPFFTFLVGRELPGGMDDTHFIDVARAYETLTPEIQSEITGMHAYHNDSAGICTTHPMVRTHPENGRKVLYANSHFVHKVLGYEKEEGSKLLDHVFDHIELKQPVFKFKWTCDVPAGSNCGTKCPECMHALMWDNRQLQHTATTNWARDAVLGKRRRELHRVTISGGEAPYFRPNQKVTAGRSYKK